MSFLRRVFSPTYRRAVEAEASGDYAAAARAYALCGLRAKVAEMHLCDADRGDSADARWRSLRTAARFADGPNQKDQQDLQRRVGQAYLALLRSGVHTDWDRMLCREAAQILLRGGDAAGAGEAYELCGDDSAAADAFRDAGELERMEAVHDREDRRMVGQREERDHAAQAELHWGLGQRDAAVQELRAALAAAPPSAGPGEAARQRLRERTDALLCSGSAPLRWEPRAGSAETRLYVGAFPLLIGRGAECHLCLRDVGVSRCHASLALAGAPTPQFTVRDLDSRNGTTLNQVPIAAELPLRGSGELGIGDHCSVDYEVEGPVLRLAIRRGLDRGLLVLASPQPQDIAGATLRFVEGRPLLEVPGELQLNGKRAPSPVQLARGDVVDLPGGRLRVLP